ncbi:hypothetical protein pb186bvf_020391 [Paramecium bursaria]
MNKCLQLHLYCKQRVPIQGIEYDKMVQILTNYMLFLEMRKQFDKKRQADQQLKQSPSFRQEKQTNVMIFNSRYLTYN